MMKLKYVWTTLLLAGIIAGCEEEEGLESQVIVEEVTKQVTEKLADQPDLTLFAEIFKEVELNQEDVEEGVTIFAPDNQAIAKRNSGAKKAKADSVAAGGLSQDELKDHIVKGVITAENLNDGDTLITLSKKHLKVTTDGEDVRVNGVRLTGKNVSTHEKFTVHSVDDVIVATDPDDPQDSTRTPQPTTGTIVVKVWNSLHWSVDKPNGKPEPGVTVYLYHSALDYTNEVVALVAETDSEGIARFSDIEGGSFYYVVAKKDGLSNLFYLTTNETGDLESLTPDGLFQNQEEIIEHAQQPDAMPGNFRWVDMNSDGVIDNSDKVAAPYEWVQIDSTETFQRDVIIGYGNNFEMGPVKNGEAAMELLEQSYQALNTWHKRAVMIDGVLSEDADCENLSQAWCMLDNFVFNPSDPLITLFWNSSYDLIGDLNKIIRDTPGLSFPEKEQTLAQAKGLRAYVYSKLLIYFGNIFLISKEYIESNDSQSASAEVYAFIMSELSEAAKNLPDAWADGKEYQINAFAARTIMAKAALQQKEYETAMEHLEWIVAKAAHALATEDAFEPMNPEIIWDFSFNLNPEFSAYFYERTFCPEARLTETYLMLAEVKFALNMSQEGFHYLHAVQNVLGMDPAISEDSLYPAWQAAMSREGGRYANLIRWNMAGINLSQKGFNPHHELLPVPQVVIDNFPNSIQNPGY